MKTLYDQLGVSRQATLVDLERAYRRQLDAHLRLGKRPLLGWRRRRLHAMREAFLLLASRERRAQYDRELAVRLQRRTSLMRRGGATVAVCSVVLGFALIGGAWYKASAHRAAEQVSSASTALKQLVAARRASRATLRPALNPATRTESQGLSY